MSLLLYFWLFLKASLFSTGGMGNLPSLHKDLIPRHWATDREFAESLTIGQITPGPNGLWVVCLAYLTHGMSGVVLASIAITVPPLLVFAVERGYTKIKTHPAAFGFVRGMSLAVVGTFTVVIFSMLRSSDTGRVGIAIAIAAFYIASLRKVSLPIIILGAAIMGILQSNMHIR